ncbi:uncharacterized protein [Epargyreus clarus]|uniref:uncharacterized protein isoform X1 n=1 Tax=Epargyreus clarus TaxID=520877 RepID=UPI003C2FBDE1
MKGHYLVILVSICVVKCLAMSHSELEDFSNFLETTAQLDLNVKSKGPDDEEDENEPISDNAWEESGKFEGDLILNERQRRLLVADIAEGLSRNGLIDSTKRWPNNEVIYYIQKEHFSSAQVRAILAGMEDLAQASCVRFTPYRKGDRDAVVIQGSRRGCFSQVGYQGGYQVLNLSGRHPVGRGCFRHGTVVHEFLHALGFYHMQSSPDRDDYIDVVWQNIIQRARHNFRKYNSLVVTDFGVGYDYESVLHYSRKAFSSNGQDTLIPKQRGAQIGQRVGLSQKDILKLNKMYCDADSNDSSNSDEGTTAKKPVTNKKVSRNKPFDGHGIGYHKGKTVVIKLKPTVELYRLPTLPKFQMFDYFSKAPQALPPTLIERNGNRKEMIFVSSTSANLEEYFTPTTSKPLMESVQDDGNYNNKMINLATLPVEAIPTINIGGPSISHQRELNEFSEALKTHEKSSDIMLPRAFPTFADFNMDYGKYYSPEIKHEKDSEIIKVDKLFNSAELQPKNTPYDSRERSHLDKSIEEFPFYPKKTIGLHQNKQAQIFASLLPQKYTSSVEDESRKSYPLTYYYDQNESDMPEYQSPLKQLHHEFNNNNTKVGEYNLLNNDVPLNEDWYTKNQFKQNPNRNYDKESYTLDPEGREKNRNLERPPTVYYAIPENLYNSNNKKPYSLFGALVPLTHNWYNKDSSEHRSSQPVYFDEPS